MTLTPTAAEKKAYEAATGRKAPWCLIFPFPWQFGLGFTFGQFILIKVRHRDIVVHEMVHVAQFVRQPLTFWLRYFWALATKGYDANPYEIEAYDAQWKVD